MSDFMNMMNQFKRSDKKQFKVDYSISNPTHLTPVINSLLKFPIALGELDKIGDITDKNLIDEARKLNRFVDDRYKQLLYKVMWLEKHDKSKLLKIIDTGIISNPNIEREMQTLIKYREQALDYAVALGVIDDYCEYLEHGKYTGPTAKL